MDVIVKDNRPSVFDACFLLLFSQLGSTWRRSLADSSSPPVLEGERAGTKPPSWRKHADSSSNQSTEATFFIPTTDQKNGILQPMDQQHPPVHHPLDACYYSVVDELQLRFIFGFTLVTNSVGNIQVSYIGR